VSQKRYVRRSLRQLSAELARNGHAICPTVVGVLLRAQDFALRVNVKRFTGPAHPWPLDTNSGAAR
jgi:Rhodopirellula transposase DDE domain